MAEAAVRIEELRQLSNSLFDALAGQGIESVDVKQSQYWKVYSSDMFNFASPEPVLGDIYDDFNDVRAEVKDPNDAVMWHAFMHLSGLMNLIAYAAENGDLTKKTVREKRG